MTLLQLDLSNFPCIQNLVKEAGEAAGVTSRINVDRILTILHSLIATKTGQVYVDNIGIPKVVLILHIGENMIFSAKQCQVLFVYAASDRRSPEAAAEMMRVIEQAARAEGCGEIVASSWCYQETDTYPDISALWEACGYRKQEIAYVKILTPT